MGVGLVNASIILVIAVVIALSTFFMFSTVAVLASVCPHTLSNRPLVIAADSVVDITLSEKTVGSCMASCDGRPGHIIQPGDTIRIARHPSTITLLHLEDHDHYSILRAKLEWGRKLTC